MSDLECRPSYATGVRLMSCEVAFSSSSDGNILVGYSGSGLDENVCEAYSFLASNYCPGDEVFFFGFSWGAYTTRACAGLVANVGLCKDIQMSRFWEM